MKSFKLRKSLEAPAFKFSTAAGCLQLDIMDVIGGDMFGMGITASAVAEAIAGAEDCTSVSLTVNSPGGDLFEGVAIYNILKNCGKPVVVNVIGLAASAASLIACAGKVNMCPGTQFMLHEAMGIEAGYGDDLRKMADVLDSV